MAITNPDLSKASIEELMLIQNEVLRNIALTVAKSGRLASGHDSHGSSHSKNTVLAFGEVVAKLTVPKA